MSSEDLPSGYQPMPADMAGSGPGGVTSLGGGVQQCGATTAGPSAAVSPSAAVAEAAQVLFAKGMAGPFVAESITAPGDRAARQLVADVAAAPEACPNFSGDAGGSEVTVSMSQMTVAPHGDAAAGVQLTATPAGLPLAIHGYVVTFAHRGLAVTVIVMSMSEVDKAEAEAVVTAAERRVRTVR